MTTANAASSSTRAAIPAASLTCEIQRWNPGTLEWQDPALPISPGTYETAPEPPPLREYEWEVTANVSARDAAYLLPEAGRRGVPAIMWTRLHLAAHSQGEADRLAMWVQNRAHCPEPKIRPLTWFRRLAWLNR